MTSRTLLATAAWPPCSRWAKSGTSIFSASGTGRSIPSAEGVWHLLVSRRAVAEDGDADRDSRRCLTPIDVDVPDFQDTAETSQPRSSPSDIDIVMPRSQLRRHSASPICTATSLHTLSTWRCSSGCNGVKCCSQ